MRQQARSVLFIFFLNLCIFLIAEGQILPKSGVYIHQNIVNDSVAQISVTTNLENADNKGRSLVIRCGIWDHREFLTRDIRNVELHAGETISIIQDLAFGMPELWNGPKHPFLYKIILEVIENGKIIDTRQLPLGLRKFGFDNNNRFVLNNKEFPLYGVFLDNKTDLSPNKDWYQKLNSQLKNVCFSGANAVFLPNTFQTDSVYSLCDSLGLIVWGSLKDNIANVTETRIFTDFIDHNYNHPSIFFWTFGNWRRNDNSPLSPVDSIGCEQIEKFNGFIKQADPGRLTFHENDIAWIPFDSIDIKSNSDRLHWYKAQWSEEPLIFITGKKDSITEDTLKRLVVYCNLDDPMLEVNGTILNVRKEGSSRIVFYWEGVGLKKGTNKIKAFARKKGKHTEDIWYLEVR
jgi:hypothetical protein